MRDVEMALKVMRWLLSALLFVGLLVAALVVGIQSEPGKHFLTNYLRDHPLQDGLGIKIGRIDGSPLGAMTLENVQLTDPKGVFASAPRISVDWRPFEYLGKHVDVRSLSAPLVTLQRTPQFNVAPTSNAPLLPDLDIDVNAMHFERIDLAPALTGKRHLLKLDGNVHIADRRAQIAINADAITAPGIAGGDNVKLTLDAVPDKNILKLIASGRAPAGGVLGTLLKLHDVATVDLQGNGDWQHWRGQFVMNVGQQQFTKLQLGADNGLFHLSGPMQLNAFYSGYGSALLKDVSNIAVTALLDQRRVALKGGVSNKAANMAFGGSIDLGKSEYSAFNIKLAAAHPIVLADKLTGTGLAGAIILDGVFEAPKIAYNVKAAALRYNTTKIDGLSANGSATFRAGRIILPIHAAAKRVTGLNAAVGDLFNGVRIDGDLAIANGIALSNNLLIRSRQINATAVVVADSNKGLYTGALRGTLNGYQLPNIGVINVTSALNLVSHKQGFAIQGHVQAKSIRLINAGAASFLGGNALANADIRYGTDGIFRANNVRLSAPQFRLSSGAGTFAANGTLSFTGQGVSNRYGPLNLALTGSLNAPVATIRAPRPGLGLGLNNVTAVIRGNNGLYRLQASSASDYGLITAVADINTAGRSLVIDLHPVRIGGVDLRGRLIQNASGPFLGGLIASGGGVSGRIDLAAVGPAQRASANLTAHNASFAGPAHLVIGYGQLKGDLILYAKPQVTADVQLADTTLQSIHLAKSRAIISLRGGGGNARWLVDGNASVPFHIAGNAALTPQLVRVALTGQANGINVKTSAPADIILNAAGYHLRSASLAVGNGTVLLTGDYGRTLNLTARLDRFDLGLLDPLLPDAGFGGSASGSIDYAQPSLNAAPNANARVIVSNFTRTTLASVSSPVDLAVVGNLTPTHGDVRAVIKRNTSVIGQAQAAVALRGGGNLQSELSTAPLSGGVRYNGPSEVLSALAALQDQSLSGPIILAADLSGSINRPQISGVIRSETMSYQNATYGTRLTKIALNGGFTNDQLNITNLTAKADKGSISGSGFISLSSARGYPLQLNLKMDNARLADGDDLRTDATGGLSFMNAPNGTPKITGQLLLPETRYQLVRQGAATVPALTGIRRTTDRTVVRSNQKNAKPNPLTGGWLINVRVSAPNQIYVSGSGLESEWSTDLRVTGTLDAPNINGKIELIRGTIAFAGHSFDLQQGQIRLIGNDPKNADINLSGTTDIDGVAITLNVTGAANNPQIDFTSTPALPKDEIMARILFGNSVGQISALQAVQLAASLNSLNGSGKGLNPLGVLQSATGIDRLRIVGPDSTTGQGTGLAAGKYLAKNIYAEIVTDTRGATATQLEITLGRGLSILSQASSFGTSAFKLRYHKEY